MILSDAVFKIRLNDSNDIIEFCLGDISEVMYFQDIAVELPGGVLLLEQHALPDSGIEWLAMHCVDKTPLNWVTDHA